MGAMELVDTGVFLEVPAYERRDVDDYYPPEDNEDQFESYPDLDPGEFVVLSTSPDYVKESDS